jgi:hypothetical protein
MTVAELKAALRAAVRDGDKQAAKELTALLVKILEGANATLPQARIH